MFSMHVGLNPNRWILKKFSDYWIRYPFDTKFRVLKIFNMEKNPEFHQEGQIGRKNESFIDNFE